MDNTEKINRIWAEIVKEEKKTVSSRHEGEMTIYEFMEQTGFTKDQAAKRLNRLVLQGKLTARRKIYVPELGGVFTLYLPTTEHQED